MTTIPEAMKTKNLTIFDRAHVTRIVADANGKVTGVTYLRDGQEFFQPAKVVLLGSYTYENSRLLLLSKSKAYPNGLANNHGQVGRHFFAHHQGGGVSALFPFDVNVWYGAPAQSTVVDDFGRYDQLRSLDARIHRRLDTDCRDGDASDRGRQHGHLRQSADVGLEMESVRARERRALEHVLSADVELSLRDFVSRSGS